MITPHLFYQIYLSFLEQNDCTPSKYGELSEYIDSAHTEVEDLSSRYIYIYIKKTSRDSLCTIPLRKTYTITFKLFIYLELCSSSIHRKT